MHMPIIQVTVLSPGLLQLGMDLIPKLPKYYCTQKAYSQKQLKQIPNHSSEIYNQKFTYLTTNLHVQAQEV